MSRPVDERTVGSLPGLSLRANFRWTFAGNVVNAASQWGMLTVLARLGNPGMVGQFVLGLAIAAPVMAMTMLQLRAVQVTDARGEYAFEDYFGTRLVWTMVGMAVIGGCAWLSNFEAETTWVILWVGLAKCIDSVTDIVRGLFQRHERMDYSGISLMLKGPSALVAMALLVWWTGNIVPAVAAIALVWLASFAAYDLVQARRLLASRVRHTGEAQRLRPRFAWKVILRLTWIAAPLGLVMFLISLQTNIPRYLVQGYCGKDDLGYFGALVYPMVAGMMVMGAMGQSASPRLAQYYLHDPASFQSLLRRLLLLATALGTALVAGTVVLGRPVLTLLYGPDYAQYHHEFIVLAIAAAIQLVNSSWGYGLTAARYFRTQVVLLIISSLATTLAAFLLVPKWGVMGGALTVLATSIVMCVVFTVTIRWAIRACRQAVGNEGRHPTASDGLPVARIDQDEPTGR